MIRVQSLDAGEGLFSRVDGETNPIRFWHTGCPSPSDHEEEVRPSKRQAPTRRRRRRYEQPFNRQRSGPTVRHGSHSDDPTAKLAATQTLAASIPYNVNKPLEYDPAAAISPKAGVHVKPEDPIVGASTVTEANGSEKVGSGGPPIGVNKTIAPLDRVRVDSSNQQLTTNLGVPVADNQHSLKAGLRGPDAARGLHPPREDHALRSRAYSRTDRARARFGGARLFRVLRAAGTLYARLALRRSRQGDARVRPLLDRPRRTRLDRHGPRRARLRREVLYRRGQLGSGRQQHAGLLHPGCDEVPRPRARRKA